MAARHPEFPYRLIDGYRHSLPVVDAVIVGPARRERVQVLVDSGASYTILHESIGLDAGFDLKAMPQDFIGFGGGKAPARRCRLEIEVLGRSITAPVLFTKSMTQFPFGLLGRLEVFNKYREIAFRDRQSRIIVRY